MAENVSRRNFVTGAVAAGAFAAAGLFGAGSKHEAVAAEDVPFWDHEADVVVCGGGGTGLAAANGAAEAGASVIVLEKTDIIGGTTRLSGGMVCVGGASYEETLGGYTGDTPDKQFEYYMACDRVAGGSVMDEELVRDYCDHALENLAWLEDKGIEYVNCFGVKPVPGVDVSLSEPPRILIPGDGTTGVDAAAGTGYVHTDPLYDAAVEAGVQFMMATEALALVVNAGGEVIGVRAQNEAGLFHVKAAKGVVLGCGGYEHDLEMARAISPQTYDSLTTKAMLCISNAANTGDGHKMGLSVGAALSCIGGCINTPTNTQIGRDPGGNLGDPIPGIGVNVYGQRFANEWTTYPYYFYKSYQQDTHNTWIIFDKKVFDMGKVALGVDSGVDSGEGGEAMKNMTESGALISGETIRELAENVGINPDGLEATLAKWNEDMANGGFDTLFGKAAGLEPIDTPPFYAAADLSACLGTIGGLKINTNAQVLNWAGEPIPRLYAGGMNSGGWIGQWYPESGTAVMGTVHWGRKGGAHAASLEPWE